MQTALASHLAHEEEVVLELRGTRGGYLVATNQGRVFVVKKPSVTGKRMSTRVAAFEPNLITGIQIHTGPISGWVVVHAAGYPVPQDMSEAVYADNAAMLARPFDNARKIVGQIEQLITSNAGPPTGDAADDVAGQIRKLAELRDAGILSEQEFAAKKQELLTRM